MQIQDGDTFEHKGVTFTFQTERDDGHGEPWKESDGHGVVSGWDFRDAIRGEWVLARDRGYKRFYNWFETMAIAKRDGWGLHDDEIAKLAVKLKRTPTKRDIRKEAVRRDFNFLRGWCSDEWNYVGVTVSARGVEDQSLWGIESNAGDYLMEVARDLADEALHPLGAVKDEAMAMGD